MDLETLTEDVLMEIITVRTVRADLASLLPLYQYDATMAATLARVDSALADVLTSLGTAHTYLLSANDYART